MEFLAQERGKKAISQGQYEVAKQAYTDANNYFKLSVKEAKIQADQEAKKKIAAEELMQMKSNVESVKQRMLEKKVIAGQLGAESAEEKNYVLALAMEKHADENFDKANTNSLLVALNKYSQATSLYEQSIDHIKSRITA